MAFDRHWEHPKSATVVTEDVLTQLSDQHNLTFDELYVLSLPLHVLYSTCCDQCFSIHVGGHNVMLCVFIHINNKHQLDYF